MAYLVLNTQDNLLEMRKSNNLGSFKRFTIALLWFAAVFDPIGSFYLRYLAIFFATVCFLVSGGLKVLVLAPNDLRLFYVRYTALILPFWGSALYMLRSGFNSEFIDTSYLAAGALALFSLIYSEFSLVEFSLKAMIFVLRLLSIVIVFAQFSILFENGIDWIRFFTENNVALLSERSYAGITFPYIYFLASSLLIFLCGHDIDRLLKRRRFIDYFNIALSLSALALTGTRAHLLIAAIYFPFFIYMVFSKHKFFWAVVSVFAGITYLYLSGSELLESFFSLKEESNSIKASFISKYAEIFNDCLSFLFGQGFNAHAWSGVFRSMIVFESGASKTELTYLELIRVFGIFIGGGYVALLAVVGSRTACLSREYRWLFPAIILFYAECSVNPYLFSTNGILPLGLVLAFLSYAGSGRVLVRERQV